MRKGWMEEIKKNSPFEYNFMNGVSNRILLSVYNGIQYTIVSRKSMNGNSKSCCNH